ncbi:MAG: hypothetical protein KDC05_04500 [Bacteroidales bacterium]|nr:hypothetical protein [Bacteroidales bacterium]
MLRNISVFYILISASQFFWFALVPKNLILMVAFGAIMLMLVVVLLGLIYDPSRRFEQNFTYEISLIFISILLSTFGAKWGHDQNFMLTAWAQRMMYFYLFYFFLHTIRIRPEDLEKLIIIIAVIYIVIFLIQYVSYPRMLFGTRADEERGTIRIFLPAKAFVVMVYFYCLQEFFAKLKLKYALFCVAAIAVTILQGTRTPLALLFLGTIIMLILSKRVQSKMLIAFLLIVGAASIMVIFQDIFLNLLEVSEEQSAKEGDDIRVKAAKFFLYEFPPTPLNYIIGNGESHMASAYGMRIWYYKVDFGYFQNDIGLLGEYTKYGILYVIAVILIVRKILAMKIDPKYMYFKYYIFISLIGMIMGGIFARSDAFTTILAIMYIIDIDRHDKKYKYLEKKQKKLQTQPVHD